MDATRATTAEAGGGGGAPRQYKRDPKGSHTGGRFTRNPSSTAHKPAPKATPAPSIPARGQHGKAMSRDGRNDPERVRQFQQLLSALGIPGGDSGTFDASTEAAVKQAQQRLGMKPTGHATQTLINKMLNAYDLSPCIKRSEDGADDIERAFPALIADETEDDEEPGGGVVEVIERAQLSTAELNDLPDDAFAYIEPGGSKDAEGRTVPRSLRHFAIHDAAHVRNALARIGQGARFGDEAMPKVRKAAKKMGIGDYDDEAHEPTGAEEPEHMMPMRSALMRCCPDEHTFAREWPLDDILIRSGGDGRTVEAYAAVFDSPTEIKDQHGHYMETIDRAAFNEVLAEGIHRVGCFYHHGMTLHGTPSDLGSVPIGSPVDIRADGKGLRTVTRFNKSALADSVLEAIRAGDLKGYSFRGGIRKSNPPRIARARDGQPLPTVTRMALGLNEYGPTPTPYYADAKILAVRSAQAIATDPVALAELQAELARILARSTPVLLDQEQETATPDIEGPGAEDQPQALRSAADIARRIRVAEILRGMK